MNEKKHAPGRFEDETLCGMTVVGNGMERPNGPLLLEASPRRVDCKRCKAALAAGARSS